MRLIFKLPEWAALSLAQDASSLGSKRTMADFFTTKRTNRIAPDGAIIPEADAAPPAAELASVEHVNDALGTFVGSKAFRPALARAIAAAGCNCAALRDAIYDRVLAALHTMPARGWTLLCVVALTFPPTTDACRCKVDAALKCATDYARHARFVREVMGVVAPSPPAAQDIAAFERRPPSVLTVTRVDGAPLADALPVAPWVDCAAVAAHVVRTRLRLTDHRRTTFGLFFSDNGRPLARGEFVGDLDEAEFVFKRVLRFLHEPSRSDDELFEKLNFLQCEGPSHAIVYDSPARFPRRRRPQRGPAADSAGRRRRAGGALAPCDDGRQYA